MSDILTQKSRARDNSCSEKKNGGVYLTASSKFLYFDIVVSVSNFWLAIFQRHRRIKNRVKCL